MTEKRFTMGDYTNCRYDICEILKDGEYYCTVATKNVDKIINVFPQGSYIGSLLYNKNDTIYVKSTEKSFYIHYPTSWEVEGNDFKPVEETKLSIYLNNLTTTGFDKVNRSEIGKVFEASFKGMDKDNNSKIKFSYRDLLNALAGTKRENLKAFAVIRKMLVVTLLASRKRTIKPNDIRQFKIPLFNRKKKEQE